MCEEEGVVRGLMAMVEVLVVTDWGRGILVYQNEQNECFGSVGEEERVRGIKMVLLTVNWVRTLSEDIMRLSEMKTKPEWKEEVEGVQEVQEVEEVEDKIPMLPNKRKREEDGRQGREKEGGKGRKRKGGKGRKREAGHGHRKDSRKGRKREWGKQPTAVPSPEGEDEE
ncbi:hypothetical protein P167DRAFT_540862 [Morchella conica CCBAS932]|uniref:Uncharacterized protein n=1 Tax=Morchella conica CCBAS932 TaxID=1392247 RepID=A0A3N4KD09_9PEZI|nr:hypothetical protein P167DRAFT_540862 [Morchella conica CCBAS932]